MTKMLPMKEEATVGSNNTEGSLFEDRTLGVAEEEKSRKKERKALESLDEPTRSTQGLHCWAMEVVRMMYPSPIQSFY